MRVGSLGPEISLEEGTATHSSIFAWGIPWTEESSMLQSVGLQRVRHKCATNTLSLSLSSKKEAITKCVNVAIPLLDTKWS